MQRYQVLSEIIKDMGKDGRIGLFERMYITSLRDNLNYAFRYLNSFSKESQFYSAKEIEDTLLLVDCGKAMLAVGTYYSISQIQFDMKLDKLRAEVSMRNSIGSAMNNVDDMIGGMGETVIKAGDATPNGWKLTQHSAEQLTGDRFGRKLTLQRLDELIDSSDAIRVMDTRTNNINVYVNSEFSKSSMLRVTVPMDGQRIISIGFEPLKRINKFIDTEIFIPIK